MLIASSDVPNVRRSVRLWFVGATADHGIGSRGDFGGYGPERVARRIAKPFGVTIEGGAPLETPRLEDIAIKGKYRGRH